MGQYSLNDLMLWYQGQDAVGICMRSSNEVMKELMDNEAESSNLAAEPIHIQSAQSRQIQFKFK